MKSARAGKKVTGGGVFDVAPRKAAMASVIKIRPVILGSDMELVLGTCEQGRIDGDSAH